MPDHDHYINDAEDDEGDVGVLFRVVGAPICVEMAMFWTCACLYLCFIFKKDLKI